MKMTGQLDSYESMKTWEQQTTILQARKEASMEAARNHSDRVGLYVSRFNFHSYTDLPCYPPHPEGFEFPISLTKANRYDRRRYALGVPPITCVQDGFSDFRYAFLADEIDDDDDDEIVAAWIHQNLEFKYRARGR